MDDVFARVVDNLLGRLTGPMQFRLYLQPAMAALLAVMDGVKDVKAGRPPYFWSLFTDKGRRAERLAGGWKSIARVFVLALVIDACYQVVVERFVYPGEMLFVAFVLAIVPYVLLRGPSARLIRLFRRSAPTSSSARTRP